MWAGVLPPTWLSLRLRLVSTDCAPSSLDSRRTPWLVILLCDMSRCVIESFLIRPVMSLRGV